MTVSYFEKKNHDITRKSLVFLKNKVRLLNFSDLFRTRFSCINYRMSRINSAVVKINEMFFADVIKNIVGKSI